MKKAKVKITQWDAAEHLKTEEDMAAYLEVAIEEGDPAVISAAIGDIARAKGMSQIAREQGLDAKVFTRLCHRAEILSLPRY